MSRPFLFNAFIYAQAGIMLDSIPAPGAYFSYSILNQYTVTCTNAPRPSPNPSPFIFSINFIYYMNKIVVVILDNLCQLFYLNLFSKHKYLILRRNPNPIFFIFDFVNEILFCQLNTLGNSWKYQDFMYQVREI